MLSIINTATCMGIEGKPVEVETDISGGLPFFSIVGLAQTTIVEAKDRIKAAIVNSGFEYPRSRITVNLAPAGFRKNGSQLDLPIATGILDCEGYLDGSEIEKYGIIGELSLSGAVLRVDGVLPMIMAMSDRGIKRFILPADNVNEAGLICDIEIYPVASLSECVEILNTGNGKANPISSRIEASDTKSGPNHDFSDIKGQEQAKRAITIAIAGGHGLLMIGSPGCGKTMLARRIPTVMPKMSNREMLESTAIFSVMGKIDPNVGMITERPFRMPHNSIGPAGLLGGGSYPVPGEITLAHNGVLFLDEVCEFRRDLIESLRIPIEDKKITHFRHGIGYTFPCDFLLVMASNPCRCGYFGDPEHICRCTTHQIENYQKKLSGPLRQRIDIEIRMERIDPEKMTNGEKGTDSATMRSQIECAREFAMVQGRSGLNGYMSDSDIEKYCELSPENRDFMERAYRRLSLSPRTYKKTLKVARTIADLARSVNIKTEHLAEALMYRKEENDTDDQKSA